MTWLGPYHILGYGHCDHLSCQCGSQNGSPGAVWEMTRLSPREVEVTMTMLTWPILQTHLL